MQRRLPRFRNSRVNLWCTDKKITIIEKYIDNLYGCKARADYYEEALRKTQAKLIMAAKQKAPKKAINKLRTRALREKLFSARYRAMQAQEHLSLDDFFRWLEINEPTKGMPLVAKITERMSTRGTQIKAEQKRYETAKFGEIKLRIEELTQETLALNEEIMRAQDDEAELRKIEKRIDENWKAIGKLEKNLWLKGEET